MRTGLNVWKGETVVPSMASHSTKSLNVQTTQNSKSHCLVPSSLNNSNSFSSHNSSLFSSLAHKRRSGSTKFVDTLVSQESGLSSRRSSINPNLIGKAVAYNETDSRSAEGFATIEEALIEIAAGRFVVVLDDEDRENEGDLIIPADRMTPEAMGFMIRYTSGLVCVAMEPERLEALQLPLMVPNQQNEDRMLTAYTISCDHINTSTGISALDRCTTVRALADPTSTPADFTRPGHIFPLKYREGGVLKRGGHTEAAVDLARMSGSAPVGVICEIVNEDGSCSRTPELLAFARRHGLAAITIADLIKYRSKSERLVERTAVARLPTEFGTFSVYSYLSKLDGIEHVALVMGDLAAAGPAGVLTRVHSECLTGDIFGSARCDCGPQLQESMRAIAAEGSGVVVYLRGHEGRGIGLTHKLRAYNLQDQGRDTVQANQDLGLPVDSREYGVGAQILQDLGVRSMRLMTNNPAKYQGLSGYGLEIVERIPLMTPINPDNRQYLETKRTKMGHFFTQEETAPSVNGQKPVDGRASKNARSELSS
eukprot:CAMPEP_0196593850 /NCGR_PEP_ID=MMETSP1081-20130531/76785_1 /TAXON_ID=36882 /ORGANISM="Pyramimonas amylifera, Strain CCMP720" /LENGTH=538 /DNA_ID=CAMNT_0041917959 /DNA_START=22 /DNA_END=1638 /DNA_ORIENTATION=+